MTDGNVGMAGRFLAYLSYPCNFRGGQVLEVASGLAISLPRVKRRTIDGVGRDRGREVARVELETERQGERERRRERERERERERWREREMGPW